MENTVIYEALRLYCISKLAGKIIFDNMRAIIMMITKLNVCMNTITSFFELVYIMYSVYTAARNRYFGSYEKKPTALFILFACCIDTFKITSFKSKFNFCFLQ